MVVHVQTSGLLAMKCYQTKRGNWFGIYESDSLTLAVEGETYAELMEDVGLTLDAVFRDMFRSKELGKFLAEHGWRLDRKIEEEQDPDEIRFDMPFLPQLMDSYDPARELHR